MEPNTQQRAHALSSIQGSQLSVELRDNSHPRPRHASQRPIQKTFWECDLVDDQSALQAVATRIRPHDPGRRLRRALHANALRNKDFGTNWTLGGGWQPANDRVNDFGCHQCAGLGFAMSALTERCRLSTRTLKSWKSLAFPSCQGSGSLRIITKSSIVSSGCIRHQVVCRRAELAVWRPRRRYA